MVNVLIEEVAKPLVIRYKEKPKVEDLVPEPVVTIKVPLPFPYKDNKAVPWNYTCQIIANEKLVQEDTSDIAGVGGITRSGRCYSPESLEKSKIEKEKDKVCSEKYLEPATKEEPKNF